MTETDRLPPWLSHPIPGEPPSPTHRRILDAYRLELGADESELSDERLTSFMEAVRWWNSGAPELDDEPSPASEQLAKAAAFVAAGGDVPAHFRGIWEQQHRETRLARAMPDPARPGWRAPRSKHAPLVESREADDDACLSSQIRATLDGWTERDYPEMQAMRDALLAVLDQHKPLKFGPANPVECSCATDRMIPYPCPTVRAVAEKLGIEVDDE